MNAICNPDIMRQILTRHEKCKDIKVYSVRTDNYYISGDTWDTNICLEDHGIAKIMKNRPEIIQKCGIEYVKWSVAVTPESCGIDSGIIRKILAYNHNIICPETFNWEEILRLLRYV